MFKALLLFRFAFNIILVFPFVFKDKIPIPYSLYNLMVSSFKLSQTSFGKTTHEKVENSKFLNYTINIGFVVLLLILIYKSFYNKRKKNFR